MKKIVAIIILFSCSKSQVDLSEQTKAEIIAADKMMSDIAVKEGFHKTLLQYADSSVIKPEDGKFPIIGKIALSEYWSTKNETTALSWAPTRAEGAKSGEIGYTFGNWKLEAKDTAFYGVYYTVWKKQKDGSWKFVLDGGHSTPKPQ